MGIISQHNLWAIRPQVTTLFLFLELVTNLGTSEIKSSHAPTCSQFGDKWNISYCTSCQIGEKLFLFPTSWREFHFPTICREVVLQLQTNLVQSDIKKYKVASRATWYHFAHFTDFPLKQSTQNCLPGQTSL